MIRHIYFVIPPIVFRWSVSPGILKGWTAVPTTPIWHDGRWPPEGWIVSIRTYIFFLLFHANYTYRQTSNISCTLGGDRIDDNSDMDWMDWTNTTARRDEKHDSVGYGAAYIRDLIVLWKLANNISHITALFHHTCCKIYSRYEIERTVCVIPISIFLISVTARHGGTEVKKTGD